MKVVRWTRGTVLNKRGGIGLSMRLKPIQPVRCNVLRSKGNIVVVARNGENIAIECKCVGRKTATIRKVDHRMERTSAAVVEDVIFDRVPGPSRVAKIRKTQWYPC